MHPNALSDEGAVVPKVNPQTIVKIIQGRRIREAVY